MSPALVWMLAAGWLLVASLLAVIVGGGIKLADSETSRGGDATWLDDQPVAVLSAAEVDRRLDTMTARTGQAVPR